MVENDYIFRKPFRATKREWETTQERERKKRENQEAVEAIIAAAESKGWKNPAKNRTSAALGKSCN